MHDKNNIYLIYKMQRRTRTRHHRKPYSTTRRVHRRRGFSKRYNRAKHTRYKKRRRRKTRRGRQRRGGAGASIKSEDVCQYDAVDNSFSFSQLDAFGEGKKHNCNVFRYKDRDSWYMYRNPNWAENGKLKCSKTSAMTKTPKVCPNQKKAAAEAKAAEEKAAAEAKAAEEKAKAAEEKAKAAEEKAAAEAKAAAAARAQQDEAKEWARRARSKGLSAGDLAKEMRVLKMGGPHVEKQYREGTYLKHLKGLHDDQQVLYEELHSMDVNILAYLNANARKPAFYS
jgi:hypothetical protein